MARRKEQRSVASCAECDSRILLKKKPRLGELVICPYCQTHLQVVSASPLELYWADYADNYEGDDQTDDRDFNLTYDDYMDVITNNDDKRSRKK